jgi:hypothetical protein
VVKGLGEISQDNKRIITMEWLAEGVACVLSVCMGFWLQFMETRRALPGLLFIIPQAGR